jgi:hypothetical protein
MQKSMKGHMELIKQTLRYLKSAPRKGILMRKHGHANIVGFVDANWAKSPLGRKFITGFCMFVGGNVVTWKSKKTSSGG